MKKNNKAINFSITGLLVGFIIIAMIGTTFAVFISDMSNTYQVTGNNTFTKYQTYTERLTDETDKIKTSSNINQSTGGLADIVGSMFSSGYAALRTTMTSFELFLAMLDGAAEDAEFVKGKVNFNGFLIMLLLIGIFVGVFISVLLKMRV